MAAEDLTTYTTVDENTDLTVAASSVTVDTMRRDVTSYVVYDKGQNHFLGNFSHTLDINISAVDNQGICDIWGLSNELITGADSIQNRLVAFVYRSVSTYYIYLRETYNGTNYDATSPYAISLSTNYYLTIARNDTTATLKVYSDSGRSVLLSTLTLTLHGILSYRYMYACLGWDSTAYPTATWTGVISNLNLNESSITQITITATLSTADEYSSSNNLIPDFLDDPELSNMGDNTITSLLSNPVQESHNLTILSGLLANPPAGNIYTMWLRRPLLNPPVGSLAQYKLSPILQSVVESHSPTVIEALLEDPFTGQQVTMLYSIDSKLMKTIPKAYSIDIGLRNLNALKSYGIDVNLGDLNVSIGGLLFDFSEFNCVKSEFAQLSNWLNVTEDVNEDFYNKHLLKLKYVLRTTDWEKWQLDIFLKAHQFISLHDGVHDLDGNAWITHINAEWRSDNYFRPWMIELDLAFPLELPPPPPPTAIAGSYWWNVAKPYYYEGWYYVVFLRKVGDQVTLYYSRTNGSVWSDPISITTETNNYNFFWSIMCLENKMFIGWVNEYPYGTSSIWTKTGTISGDGTISFNANVFIENTAYSGGGCIRAALVGGERRVYFMASQHAGGSAADNIWLSTNDGASWTYKGYCSTFGQNYWWNHRLIPFKDGNKLIALFAPRSTSYHYEIMARYRDLDVGTCATQQYLGTLNDEWYLFAKGEGCYRNIGGADWVHAAWISSSGVVLHARVSKSDPSTWETLGQVATLSDIEPMCASPVYDPDSALGDIYIIYSDGNTIYYKKWIYASTYGPEEIFYTSTNSTITNLSVYPEVQNGRIVIAWNEIIETVSYVFCSAILV